jgi:hypothetical protein
MSIDGGVVMLLDGCLDTSLRALSHLKCRSPAGKVLWHYWDKTSDFRSMHIILSRQAEGVRWAREEEVQAYLDSSLHSIQRCPAHLVALDALSSMEMDVRAIHDAFGRVRYTYTNTVPVRGWLHRVERSYTYVMLRFGVPPKQWQKDC